MTQITQAETKRRALLKRCPKNSVGHAELVSLEAAEAKKPKAAPAPRRVEHFEDGEPRSLAVQLERNRIKTILAGRANDLQAAYLAFETESVKISDLSTVKCLGILNKGK
jgi:hypothetical protein